MTEITPKPSVGLRAAFEAERARRDAERRAREEAERRQQEEDLGRAEALERLLAEDLPFLQSKGLTLDRRRYTVTLEHPDFKLTAYFEGGQASVRSADKRTAISGAAPRKETLVGSVEDALLVMAQYLADEGA
ncbi:MAG: hypothetical protein WCY15_15725 [Phenylobacterium sp.]|jgi:hypothetical protein|uniref:hypothetical protein n=1 Tax=Phenylobacterium sp. TaxID=1871053 RepID=UPI002A31FD21|nr:hypothetical protein [Phenylobacterium sp.]MDD3837057.1 hypothetical protein [Phenylobacterium sp.]MDX9999249.1 hypothetical protein [Phenylobacterium sp.]